MLLAKMIKHPLTCIKRYNMKKGMKIVWAEQERWVGWDSWRCVMHADATNGNEEKDFQVGKEENKYQSSEDDITHTTREVGNLLATNLITASNNLSKAITGTVALENK